MRTAYIIVHGFLAKPKSVIPLKKELVKYNIKEQDIYLPELPQKGYVEMIDYLKKYILHLEKSYSAIILIGYSMGGLVSLGTVFELKLDKKLSRLVLINAPIKIWTVTNFFYTLKMSDRTKRIYHIKTVLSSLKLKKIINNVQLTNLRKTIAKNLKLITLPTYVVQMKHDYVARPESGSYIYDNIYSEQKKYVEYENGTHFVPDDSAEIVIKDLMDWLKIIQST